MTFSGNQAVQVSASPAYQLDIRSSELSMNTIHWQFKHQYQIFNYDKSNSSTPLTNGHLHTLSLEYRNDYKQLIWAIAPTLSTSSNQVRHSHALNSSAFRLDGHLVWQESLTDSGLLYAGACASSLSGNYQLLPALGFQYKSNNVNLLLGYPVSRLDIQATSILNFVTDWSLQGQQWQVLDSDLQNRSDFHYEAEQLRLGIKLKPFKHHLFEAYWLKKTNQMMEYMDRNNNAVKFDIDDSSGWMIAYRYLM